MTNQPAAGTFSRLMATTAPMKEKPREEQEKAIRPPVATVTAPIVETPQKGKKQRMAGKNPPNHQVPKGNEISYYVSFCDAKETGNQAPAAL
jgi:hypothetical protein